MTNDHKMMGNATMCDEGEQSERLPGLRSQSVSDTTLTDEYLTVMLAMGVTLEQIKRTIVIAAEGSFQPPAERKRLAEWFRKELGMTNGQ